MRILISILILVTLTGCVRYYKPGAGQAEFNADSAFCEMNAYKFAPPAVERIVIRGAYREPTQTNCLGNINMNENGTASRGTYYGNTTGTVINNCTTTGGEYVPPATVDVDNNQGARNAAYRNCLHQRGWSTVKPNEAMVKEVPKQSEKYSEPQRRGNQNVEAYINFIANPNDSHCSPAQNQVIQNVITKGYKGNKYSYINIDNQCRYSVITGNGLYVTTYAVGDDNNLSTYQDGPTTYYWIPGGIKKAERFYVYNSKTKLSSVNGLVTTWHKNGVKQSEVNYKNGVADGIETSWDENGSKVSEIIYRNGLQVNNTINEKRQN